MKQTAYCENKKNDYKQHQLYSYRHVLAEPMYIILRLLVYSDMKSLMNKNN